ncbi:MAG: DNA repair protein RadC [Aerococcus sp.]|nr:DNA repair protein RadC [Aerococcus sp.]
MEGSLRIKEMPEMMRPRERMAAYGSEALPTYELLAVLLGSGQQGENAVQLAMRLLNHFETLFALKHATYEELTQISGIGPSKALRLMASIALGERIEREKRLKHGPITSCEAAGNYFVSVLKDLEQEHVVVLFLNTKNEILRQKTIFIGSLNTSVAHPREIFKEAVRTASAHIIVAHNHPSGNTEPSQADLDFTERLVQAGEMIGIDVLDHLIIGETGFFSMRAEGLL